MDDGHGSTCCVCHETLSNRDTLEMHIAIEHVFYSAYECEHCKTDLFPTDYALRQHYQLVHRQTSFVIKYQVTPSFEEKRNLLEKLLNTSISQSHTTLANVTPPNCNSNETQFQDRAQFQDQRQIHDRMPANYGLSGQTNGSRQNEQMPSFSALLKFNDISGEIDSSHLGEEMNGTNDHSLISGETSQPRDLNHSTEPILPISYSKPLPPFVCDSLYYLNRDQLERFAIVCRPLKSFIDRYLHSKPYRVFDGLSIRGGSYCLYHNEVQWHPNYSAQQFSAGQICSIDECSLSTMRLFLSATVRIKKTIIDGGGNSTFNSDHIAEMESMSYLWRDSRIDVYDIDRIDTTNLQLIFNSPTILQCRNVLIDIAHFSLKEYKVLYTVEKILVIIYYEYDIDPNHWPDFLEQPGNKPVVVFACIRPHEINNLLDRLKENFSSAVVPNAFKIVFQLSKYDDISTSTDDEDDHEPLTEFRKTNKTSAEILELKKGLPVEYQPDNPEEHDHYTLERSSI